VFMANTNAVRTLGIEIARLADAHDRTRLQTILADAFRLAGVPSDKLGVVASFDFDLDKLDLTDFDNPERASPSDMSTALAEAIKVALSKDPTKILELRRIAQNARGALARQGQLLRRGAITILVSFFETLVADLVGAYYLRFPEALPADATVLTLADLRRLGSVADAESIIATREAEKLLRESLDTQMKFFLSRFKLIQGDLPDYESMTEITQRRNIIVHNNSIVNAVYLDKTTASLIAEHNAQTGKRLPISAEYLQRAIDITTCLGFVLIQHAWRRWGKESGSADDYAVGYVYELLVERRYQLAETVASVMSSFDVGTEEIRRIILINRAIALKSLARHDEMQQLLATFDWTATSLRFKVVLAALRDHEDEFFDLAKCALAAKELGRAEFEQWPAFSLLREHSDYFTRLDLDSAVSSSA